MNVLCLLSLAAAAVVPGKADHSFGVFQTEQPVRLAMTPTLDGQIGMEEWDFLSDDGGCASYFQWEPGSVYWGATIPEGEDVLLSLDEGGDGWLVGDDNVEVRVGMSNGQPVVSVRRLDASDPAGPTWVPSGILGESLRFACTSHGDSWILEARYDPPAPVAPAIGRHYGVRIDAVPAGQGVGEAYIPRQVAVVNLQVDFGQGLPTGFSWKPGYVARHVPVEDKLKMTFDFRRQSEADFRFNEIEVRAEGPVLQSLTSARLPFPEWNAKGKANYVYETPLSPTTQVGYRVVRATLRGADGRETVLRSSFRVAELIDFDVDLPKSLPLDPKARLVKGKVTLRSNGVRSVNGRFKLDIPKEWTVTRGADANLTIYHPKGIQRIPLELIIPGDTVGTYPLTFTAKIGDREVKRTIYIPVGQS
ncbi:MAG: hypothetical protein KIT11_00330 [Fimbriimonadaceae bacterium]|nr:hypothetical protein [Fimbriimonadaceae bacterium]QYK55181.1 MAG: hypothetical protein KF733_09205 [Fimbriimonadaceae bacterium]